MRRFYLLALSALAAAPALAHPGGHDGMAVRQALAHLLEPDHLAVAALVVFVGALAWGAGRAAIARQSVFSRRRGGRT